MQMRCAVHGRSPYLGGPKDQDVVGSQQQVLYMEVGARHQHGEYAEARGDTCAGSQGTLWATSCR